MKTIKTVCHRDCPDTCFMDVSVDRGTIITTRGSKENPLTRGFLCPRGNGDPQRVYSPKRVLYPHLKSTADGSDSFSRIGWEAALDMVADRIRTTIAEHGSESVLLYDYPGNVGFLAWHYPKRLWSALAATTTDYALCSSAGHKGIGLHYGSSHGLSLAEVGASTAIIFWGHNAKISAPHLWAMARRAKKARGAVIVCVDPRESPTAAAADIWLQPRPGSDVALCYGLANYLIEHQGIDLTFIDRTTTGFPAYAEAASAWTHQRVQQATGVDRETVARFAELLMTKRPAAFMIGMGLQKSRCGAEAARAVSLLPALLGLHRGFHYSNAQGLSIDWSYMHGKQLSGRRSKVVSQVQIGNQLAAGAFKLVYVMGSNPAVTLPDQCAVRHGLDRDDVFVVVHDTHWSETADRADVVLPAATFLEKRDLCISDHHPYCRLSERAIDPLGQSRHEIQVMRQLAKRLQLNQPYLDEDPWEALEKTLDNTFVEGGLSSLLAGKTVEVRLRPRNDYPTPSTKIELAATAPGKAITALPFQHPMPEGSDHFVLLNSATANYTHSQFTDVYGPIPQIVWIHPADAAARGIQDGGTVLITNDLASVCLAAKLTTRVSKGSLWAPRPLIGLNGIPLNALTPGISQAIGNGPIFNSVQVRIMPVDEYPTDGAPADPIVDGE
jgi:anaerobic selenocysteine-containing dehydrogenase